MIGKVEFFLFYFQVTVLGEYTGDIDQGQTVAKVCFGFTCVTMSMKNQEFCNLIIVYWHIKIIQDICITINMLKDLNSCNNGN